MSPHFEPSEQFSRLFSLALEHGFNSISDNAGPLIPFTLTVIGAESPTLARHVGADRVESLEFARRSIEGQRGKLDMYAIAWDGPATVEGVEQDAIFVEAGEADDPDAVVFCQRCTALKKRFLRRGYREKIGNPALIGPVPSRIWTGSEA